MKILQIRLQPFGQFLDMDLSFPDDAPAFHLVYGHNEAGKSTTLRAITNLLFGIPGNSTDGYKHGNTEIRIKARVQDANGDELRIARRKGNANTLLDWDNGPLSEMVVSRSIGSIDETTFGNMFGLNHGKLVEGGRALSDAKGAIGKSLFQAGTGINHLGQLCKDLEDECAKLLSRSKSSQILAAKERYDTAIKDIQANSVSSKTWKDLEDALAQKSLAVKQLRAKVDALAAETTHQGRLFDAYDHFLSRRAAEERIAEMGDVVVIPVSVTGNRAEFHRSITETSVKIPILQEKLSSIESELDRLNVDHAILSYAEPIEGLVMQLGAVKKAQLDIPRVEQERDVSNRYIAGLLTEIGAGNAVPALTIAQKSAISELVVEHSKLEALSDALVESVQNHSERLSDLNQKRDAVPPLRDTHALNASVSAASQNLRVDEQLSLESARSEDLRRQAEECLLSLSGWTGTIDDAITVVPPSEEVIDSFVRDRQRVELLIQSLTERVRENENEITELAAQLEQLYAGREIPSVDLMAAARSRRQDTWKRVVDAWGAGADIHSARDEADTEQLLVTAYENTVTFADSIADSLRDEAQRVAKASEVASRRAKAERDLAELHSKANDAMDDLVRHTSEWNTLWAGAGVTASSPAEMRIWRGKFNEARVAIEQYRRSESAVAQLRQWQHDQVQLLKDSLMAVGVRAVLPETSLAAWADFAKSIALKLDTAAATYERLTEAQREAQSNLDRANEAYTKWHSDRSLWHQRWAVAMTPLGLTGETNPRVAQTIVDKIAEISKVREEISDKQARIDGMVRDCDTLLMAVNSVAATIAPYLVGNSPETSVAELKNLLSQTQKDANTQFILVPRLKETRDELAVSVINKNVAEQNLQELCKQFGAADHNQLSQFEERSARYLAINDTFNNSTESIRRFRGTQSLEEFLLELEDCDPDSLQIRIHQYGEEANRINQNISDLDQQIGSLEAQQTHIKGGQSAADAAEAAQEALADICSAAERYARVKLADVILKRQIEAYRKANQGPVLNRGSIIFSELTVGKFSALETNYDDLDKPELLAIRDSGERVKIAGLSDGTRDLLYLALRIASLENYIAHNEPIPFVVDDILINLDDRRSAAALRVLADLSSKTQVIFFTHHAHLMELAQQTLPSTDYHTLNFEQAV